MDIIWRWLADGAPRKLVYFCAIRLGAHATTGKYSSQIVPELTFMDALRRWEVKGPSGESMWEEVPNA